MHNALGPCLLSLLPLGERHSLSVSTGRSALAKALDTASKGELTGRVWLPSLCCASLAPPFLRRGFTISFYSTAPLLLPRLERGDVFLYIHFCGFPNRLAERALDALPKGKRPIIIEDCVHSLFTPGTGRYGDFTLYSFRKYLPVPDGGLLLSRTPLDGYLAPPLERFISIAAAGLMSGSRRFLAQGEAILDADNETRAPSVMGELLLDRLPWEHIPETRRRNYAYLAERLGLPPLPDGTVPLGAPLHVAVGKAELERRLRASGFELPLSWDAPPGVPSDEADRLVILPCDDQIEEKELERLAGICGEWIASHSTSSSRSPL